MEMLLANYTTTISELKKSPSKIIKEASEPVAILNHNKPTAYIIPSKTYEKMLELIEDYELSKIIKERLPYNKDDLIEVDINEL